MPACVFSYQDPRLAAKVALNALAEDAVADMGVDGRERVVQQVHISISVHGTRHGDALALAATQVDAALAN